MPSIVDLLKIHFTYANNISYLNNERLLLSVHMCANANVSSKRVGGLTNNIINSAALL